MGQDRIDGNNLNRYQFQKQNNSEKKPLTIHLTPEQKQMIAKFLSGYQDSTPAGMTNVKYGANTGCGQNTNTPLSELLNGSGSNVKYGANTGCSPSTQTSYSEHFNVPGSNVKYGANTGCSPSTQTSYSEHFNVPGSNVKYGANIGCGQNLPSEGKKEFKPDEN